MIDFYSTFSSMILFTNAKKLGNLMVLIEPHLIIRYRYLFSSSF